MDNRSLEECLNAFTAEMDFLKNLRDEMESRGIEGVGNLRDMEQAFETIQNTLNGTIPYDPNNRMFENLQDAIVERMNESLQPDNMFIHEGVKQSTLRLSHVQLQKYTSKFETRVGSGGFGDVYKGKFPNGVLVAVKVLKEDTMDDMEEQFIAEVSTMGKTYHRNLVKLFGFCFEPGMKALVFEYMENGSLDKILYENNIRIHWEKLYAIAIDIAKGISYLHESCDEQIIHHDIKAGNVLLDSNLSPKIADFGLAKLCSRDFNRVTQTGFGGTPGYASPEVCFKCAKVTYKSDVFSFGMMLFEVLRRKRNHHEGQEWFPGKLWEMFEKEQLDKVIKDCGIEEKDKEKAKTLSMVALWCSQLNPEDRPSMSTVVKMLEGEIQPPPLPPSNPFPYHVSVTGGATRTGGPTAFDVYSLVSPASYERLYEDSFQDGGKYPTDGIYQNSIFSLYEEFATSRVSLKVTSEHNASTQNELFKQDFFPTSSDAMACIEKERPGSTSIELNEKNQEVFKEGSDDNSSGILKELERKGIQQRFSHGQLQTFTSHFSCQIGSSEHGEVYKGKYSNGVEVAVKVLEDNGTDALKMKFMAEVFTMGELYHRNIVKLYGFCFEQNMKAIIYEYIENGSLDKALYGNHHSIGWEKLYGIATETAKALSYLHENCEEQIIHFDVKASHVFLDSNLSPKLAGFGFASRERRDCYEVSLPKFKGTPDYAAPEVCMVMPKGSYKSDVYSFGILMFEVLGRRRIQNSERENWFPRQVWEKFDKGQLDDIMEDCGIEEKDRKTAGILSMVALWCAHKNPKNRPSMSTVVKVLEGQIQAMPPSNPFIYVSSSTSTMRANYGNYDL